ncbi:flagellar hook-associated protein FlgL [Thioalkalicoccus limnaeus]|uniref:Flagellar hook-associated protein FlgL n=1 Tax=Thioalkalicoccus limnaeus TaxID=120681 RepID=A0ABV4BBP0_9GAMM
MRISTQQFHQRAVDMLHEQQTRLVQTQRQLATGRRFEVAAEDPLAAGQALRLTREVATTEQYQANANAVRLRQELQEAALGQVTEVLHQARELLVQAHGAASFNANERHAFAQRLEQHLTSLVGFANARDGGGEYLFAGDQSGTRPFSDAGQGQVVYQGDLGQRHIPIGPGVSAAMTASGAEVFGGVREGNGRFVTAADPSNTGSGAISIGQARGDWTSGAYRLTIVQPAPARPPTYEVHDADDNLVAAGDYVSGAPIRFQGAEVAVTGSPAHGDTFQITPAGQRDLFSILRGAAQALTEAGEVPAGRARLQVGLNRGLAELDAALDHVLSQRAQIGARLDQIDRQTDANEAFRLVATEALSEVQDLNYAEAAMRLQTGMLALEAAQRSYVSIQDLSLFRFLR